MKTEPASGGLPHGPTSSAPAAACADKSHALSHAPAPAPSDVYANNEAVCTVVGVFALPTVTPSGCGRLPGFVVWKAAHIGVVAVDALVDLTLAGAVVADSHIGVSLNYVLSKDSQARSDIVDSLIVGSSNASASCAVSASTLSCSPAPAAPRASVSRRHAVCAAARSRFAAAFVASSASAVA